MNQVEKFIEKARTVHGELFSYELIEACDGKTPVEIVCSIHGSFFQRKDVHLKGGGCKLCLYETMKGPRKTTDQYIEEARKIHGDKYDYSQAEYTHSHGKLKVICTTHGIFEQSANAHLNSKGCPQCSWDLQRYSNEDFLGEAVKFHGTKYDYSKVEYLNFNSKVIIGCPEHGEFEQSAGMHMQGRGCQKCSQIEMGMSYRLDTDTWLGRVKETHGDLYDYSESVYVTSNDKIKIICAIHGPFMQRPACHVKGKGCIKCRNDKTTYDMVERYSSDDELAKRAGSIYILEMTDGNEIFLKLGITCNKKGRMKVYNREKDIYNYSFVYEKELPNLETALLERELKRQLKSLGLHYKPTKKFTGHTECFSSEAKDLIIKIIEGNSSG